MPPFPWEGQPPSTVLQIHCYAMWGEGTSLPCIGPSLLHPPTHLGPSRPSAQRSLLLGVQAALACQIFEGKRKLM